MPDAFSFELFFTLHIRELVMSGLLSTRRAAASANVISFNVTTGLWTKKKKRSPSGLQTWWLWHIIGFCSFRFIIRLERIISSSVFWRQTEKQHDFLSVQFVSGGTPHLLRLTRSHFKFTDSEGCFACYLSLRTTRLPPTLKKKKGRRLCAFPISSCGAPRGPETLWTPAEETEGGQGRAWRSSDNVFSVSDKKKRQAAGIVLNGDKLPKW